MFLYISAEPTLRVQYYFADANPKEVTHASPSGTTLENASGHLVMIASPSGTIKP